MNQLGVASSFAEKLINHVFGLQLGYQLLLKINTCGGRYAEQGLLANVVYEFGAVDASFEEVLAQVEHPNVEIENLLLDLRVEVAEQTRHKFFPNRVHNFFDPFAAKGPKLLLSCI